MCCLTPCSQIEPVLLLGRAYADVCRPLVPFQISQTFSSCLSVIISTSSLASRTLLHPTVCSRLTYGYSYDHLDLPSIQEIISTRGDDVTFLVPLGIKKWVVSAGASKSQVYELDWWDEIVLPPSYPEANSSSESECLMPSSVTFACVPAQHTSGK